MGPSCAARIVLVLLAGVLFSSALGLAPWWPAAWQAPIPLLVVALHAEGCKAGLLAWLVFAPTVSKRAKAQLK
jgi:hypothetical protein